MKKKLTRLPVMSISSDCKLHFLTDTDSYYNTRDLYWFLYLNEFTEFFSKKVGIHIGGLGAGRSIIPPTNILTYDTNRQIL